MAVNEQTAFLRNRLDRDLKRIVDKANVDCQISEYLKILCMCGIIQELREIHRTRTDLEERR